MRILVKTYAGSYLFGTNTPESDTDYKGVYLPSAEKILLGSYSETIQKTTGASDSKNTSEDEDVELYSLTKFFKMLQNGDTAAIELLFTPENMIVQSSPEWEDIVKVRDQLISKKIKGIIGYSRHQANMYGIKGIRLDDLNCTVERLKFIEKRYLSGDGSKLKHAWKTIEEELEGLQHVEFMELTPNRAATENVPAVSILGKKFDWHCSFTYVLQNLKTLQKGYGRRAREAKSKGGVDYKALSHALRVSIQGSELLETGKITLPLKEQDLKLVRDVKLGNIESIEVSELIEKQLDHLEKLYIKSELRDKLDESFINSIIVKLHKGVIYDE